MPGSFGSGKDKRETLFAVLNEEGEGL